MSTTRLLLLGVVRIFQPAYGYQLRRELLTWNVEDVGEHQPRLDLHRAAHAVEARVPAGDSSRTAAHRPGRTSYKLTADGETEYFSLLRGMLWTVDGFHPDRMQATMSFMWSLRRDEVIAALEARISQLESWLKAGPFSERHILEDPATPNHVVEMFRITNARDGGELRVDPTSSSTGSATAPTPSPANPPTGIPTPACSPTGAKSPTPPPPDPHPTPLARPLPRAHTPRRHAPLPNLRSHRSFREHESGRWLKVLSDNQH